MESSGSQAHGPTCIASLNPGHSRTGCASPPCPGWGREARRAVPPGHKARGHSGDRAGGGPRAPPAAPPSVQHLRLRPRPPAAPGRGRCPGLSPPGREESQPARCGCVHRRGRRCGRSGQRPGRGSRPSAPRAPSSEDRGAPAPRSVNSAVAFGQKQENPDLEKVKGL